MALITCRFGRGNPYCATIVMLLKGLHTQHDPPMTIRLSVVILTVLKRLKEKETVKS